MLEQNKYWRDKYIKKVSCKNLASTATTLRQIDYERSKVTY